MFVESNIRNDVELAEIPRGRGWSLTIRVVQSHKADGSSYVSMIHGLDGSDFPSIQANGGADRPGNRSSVIRFARVERIWGQVTKAILIGIFLKIRSRNVLVFRGVSHATPARVILCLVPLASLVQLQDEEHLLAFTMQPSCRPSFPGGTVVSLSAAIAARYDLWLT